MVVFEIPSVSINIAEHAANAVIRLNQEIERSLSQFISAYESFWRVSGRDVIDPKTQETSFVSAGSEYTLAQMQHKIDAMGSAAIGLLILAGMERDKITAAETFIGQQMLPTRYKSPAFAMKPITSPSDPIVLTGLSEAWTPPNEEESNV